MKKLIILASIAVLVILYGCSSQDKSEDTSAQIKEGTSPEVQSQPKDAGEAEQASAAQEQEAQDLQKDEPAETEAEVCEIQCTPGTSWCQGDGFYACIEEDGCVKTALVEPCGQGYSCETTMWCTSESSDTKLGIIPLSQLTAMTPVKGEIGEEFSLNTDTYTGLLCSISKIVDGQAIFECR